MTVLLVILVLAAVVFGVGAVLEGLLWGILLAVALLAVAAWLGMRTLRGATH